MPTKFNIVELAQGMIDMPCAYDVMPYVALSIDSKAGFAERKNKISDMETKRRGMTRALNSKHRKKPYSFILAIGDMLKPQFILEQYELPTDKKLLRPEIEENSGAS